ncbi:uncharacterized protein CC84DRAFT_787471 [Paraphaeosphaeria sporulosa]|uniref:EthD domain-containing protein n=1 Tax=Paraphaeosphaeria sporulosa TaxID=1460663 RepID=A0A177CBZ1_9PLEO|nr:uncharacterized protein CC84DRAFT_787471 [Paraphaeosphaeria sporulosa]OAG04329.1 hypothetical protein CC84DRAFT_787471 [Paraphaeosphaeria sporulosa]
MTFSQLPSLHHTKVHPFASRVQNPRDTKYVELLKEIAVDHLPLTHPLLHRSHERVGAQKNFTYDAIAELVLPDEASFQTFFGIISEPDAATRIAAREEACIVRGKVRAVVLCETTSTTLENGDS